MAASEGSSTKKMMADSTQSEAGPEEKRARKRKKEDKKGKKTKHKKGKTKDSQKDENIDSDQDLGKELKPIGEYIKTRDVMLEHMMKSVRGATLRGMIPEILKPLPLEELQKLFLEQLEVMSKKRIRRILAGDNPESISSSGTEESSEDERLEEDPDDKSKTVEQLTTVDSTSLGSPDEKDLTHMCEAENVFSQRTPESEHSNSDMEKSEVSPGQMNVQVELSSPEEGEASDSDDHVDSDQPVIEVDDEDPITITPESSPKRSSEEEKTGDKEEEMEDAPEPQEQDKEEDVKMEEKPSSVPAESSEPTLTKSQMEILELEMRARAIKAMLKANQSPPK